MYQVPICFYTKEITNKIDDLIQYSGYESYDKLDDAEEAELASYCIKAFGDEGYLCLAESNYIDSLMIHFRDYLISHDQDDAIDLLACMKKSAVHYFKKEMKALFEERLLFNSEAASQIDNLGDYYEEPYYEDARSQGI